MFRGRHTNPRNTAASASPAGRRGPSTKRSAKRRPASGSSRGKQRSEPKPIPPHNKLLFETERFLTDLDCARELYESVVPLLRKQDEERTSQFEKSANRLKSLLKRGPKDRIAVVDEIRKLASSVKRLTRANIMFRRQSLVLLISRLDEFAASALRVAYGAFPDRLQQRDRTLRYEEFLDAKSIEDVRSRFIESEINRILRDSHSDHIKYLDDTFKLGIRDNFTALPTFIEIAERRHLFVHTGGTVTRQYLEACRKAGVVLEDEKYKVGDNINLTDAYYAKAIDVVYELGLRVGQGLTRRLFPDHLGESDVTLITWGLELLKEERLDLAGMLFDFGLALPEKHVSDDATRRVFLVNRAIAAKWAGNNKQMDALLDKVDWSAASSRFLVVVKALKGDFDGAATLMQKLGRGEITENDFQTWPAFREFRATEQFRRAYKKTFRREFKPKAGIPDAGL